MEQLELEQTENEAQTALAENDLGEGTREFPFKNFKDVKSLQKAYGSLESEFTKRSQKIKELEGDNQRLMGVVEQMQSANSTPQKPLVSVEEQTSEFLKKYPHAKIFLKELTEKTATLGENFENGFLDGAYISLLEEKINSLSKNIESEEFLKSHIEGTTIKDEIIKNYLQDIKNSKPKIKLISGEGEISLTPIHKPKTLEEASKLAKDFWQKR